jgi:cytochrome c biogenesis protein CcmG/thiol:disulfide interchange protein DsbE
VNRRRAIAVAAVVVVVGALAWAAFVILARGTSDADSPLLGKPAPAVLLPQLEGADAVRLSSPGKVTVINFWAPWCVPCLAEHQMLNRAVATYPADQVRFVAIAYQSRDTDVTSFLDRVGRNVATFTDEDGIASIDFGVTGVPETFVVDQLGVVRAHVNGALTQRKLTDLLRPLLNATAAPA